jgi:HPt (histidine-containing phosphotransfer) domain-containing protein
MAQFAHAGTPHLPDFGRDSGTLVGNRIKRTGEMAMVQTALAQSAIETVEPKVPESLPAIDRGHLARMTFGDRSLEHEVLHLFDRQSALLIARMRTGDGAIVGALAHTLKGSAAGIGAKSVARAAEAAEQAATQAPADLRATIDRLALAVDEARALIAELLRAE